MKHAHLRRSDSPRTQNPGKNRDDTRIAYAAYLQACKEHIPLHDAYLRPYFAGPT